MSTMILPRLALAALFAVSLVGGAALAGEAMRFKSVSVQLPQSDGPSRAATRQRQSTTTVWPATRPRWC